MTEPAAAAQPPQPIPLFGNKPPQPAPPPAEQKAAADARAAVISDRVKSDTADAVAKGYPDPTKSAPAPNEQPGDAAAAAAAKPAAGEQRVKIGDYDLSADDIRAIWSAKAEQDARKAQIPADAAGYKAELPADLKLPEGISFKFDPADPMLADAKAWAHRNGLSQQQLSEALGLYASARATETKVIADLAGKERAALGPNAATRVDAITTWMRATFGDEIARPVLSTLATEKHVRMFEQIMGRYASQGAAGFSQQHRDPGPNGGMTQEQWNGMSFTEKQQWQQSNGARR